MAKRRILDGIGQIARFYHDDGTSLPWGVWNEALEQELLATASLSAAYGRLSHSQRSLLRDQILHPPFDYLFAEGGSWSEDSLTLLKMLDDGKAVSVAAPADTKLVKSKKTTRAKTAIRRGDKAK